MSIFSENLRFLRAERQLSQQKLAEALIITRAALSKYEEGKSEPPLIVLSRMAKYFHLSMDVLVGVDLHSIPIEKLLKMEDNRILLPITLDKQGKDNIEIVPLKAKAGYMQGYSDPEFIESLQQMQMPFLPSGKYRAFPIEGDSMPPHKNGSFIIAKYIENLQDIKDGSTYIVLLRNEGIVYKRLHRKNKNNNSFIFKSDNKAYQDYEVKSAEILELWEHACSFCLKEYHAQDIGVNDVQDMFTQLRMEMKELKQQMKKAILVAIILLGMLPAKSFSQINLYKGLSWGEFGVAFSDTILYNDNRLYKNYGYEGPAPLFVQIWWPEKGSSKPNYMRYQDFANGNLPENLLKTYEALQKEVTKYHIEAHLSENIVSETAPLYMKGSAAELNMQLDKLMSRSIRRKLNPALTYPVIVYHHGSQGFSLENLMMAEFFASHGYIVISSNYHLPYPGQSFGARECLSSDYSNELKLIDFANRMRKGQNLYYIGHSWGAQVGWSMLPTNKSVNGFISLETTLEWKTDTVEIKDKWPFVYHHLVSKKEKLNMPCLAIANTQKNEAFPFFKNKSNAKLYFVTAKTEFSHESYLSSQFQRIAFQEEFPQADQKELQAQFDIYKKQLKLSLDFLNSIQTKTFFDPSSYRSNFFINN